MSTTISTDNPLAAATPGCGGACQVDPADDLPKHIRERVQDHPCYSEQAHHRFARMHVAVAPACNIQCHYCNRKYDCANESRPGVASELLTPEQAARKALLVAAEIPRMSVVGIAGPGDPLANPDRTFETLRLISIQLPNVRLCISTNGLALPEYADALADLGVEHVTITINCVDPQVGARIYPWIFWNHRRIRGEKAAAILVDRQLEGLDRLVQRGVLVKINSVLIPGINDQHLASVSRIVKQRGAFLHNVLPLISRPEHGTYYGVTGQREPTPEELESLRDTCGNGMRMMRHCRQCRADAVGLLGEDRSAEFANAAHNRPVLMAVASRGGELVDEHFGHAREFLIYEVAVEGVRLHERRSTATYCTGPDACGDAESALAGNLQALSDCKAVLCARIGFEPWQRLQAAGIQPDNRHAMTPIKAALRDAYREMIAGGYLDAPAPAALKVSA